MRIDVTTHRRSVVLDVNDGKPLAILRLTPHQAKELAENLLSAAVRAEYRLNPNEGRFEAAERGGCMVWVGVKR